MLTCLFFLCLLFIVRTLCRLGMGMMPNAMIGGGGDRSGFGMQGHFNPTFMQGVQGGGGNNTGFDGSRKRFKMEESG